MSAITIGITPRNRAVNDRIGPKEHLSHLRIPLLVDLPIGQTLYDHIGFPGLILNTNIATEVVTKLLNTKDLTNWYKHTTGPLTSLDGFKALGYININSSNEKKGYRMIHYGNYFTDPEEQDTKTLIAGIRLIIKLIEGSEAFKKYNTHLERKLFLGCEHFEFDSDDYWKCALQFMATTLYHQTSTCKMGPADDSTSVVNHELRVYGIGNLRVADSSIIPVTLSAHTSAPTIMVGEKASDLIKKFWGVL
ncbi:hypothetical protein ILUMI_16444 [Ignelater luminosus]|uniref:Glucose-methanol-choline oxidoreductase C-terminal domain-containing protein n=1 Tax=Ignelater luminosus TaxID=2038154 RepID=A0A8K0CNK7_IGNLU|nr:hypothetical protein ILUMI_16444 [Ignelater luminosus]